MTLLINKIKLQLCKYKYYISNRLIFKSISLRHVFHSIVRLEFWILRISNLVVKNYSILVDDYLRICIS